MTLLTRRAGKADSERGTSVASAVIIVTIVLLIAELVVVGGRMAGAHGAVSNAVREAARQGSLVQSEDQLESVVLSVAAANLADNGQNCELVEAVKEGTVFEPGRWVTAEVTCTIKLSDLSMFGLPLPDAEITKSHRETLETYRAFGVVNS